MGNRMSTYGPKSLLTLDGHTTLIERQINIIRRTFRKCEIILVVGFQAQKVMNNTPDNIVKIENEHHKDTNVVRSIGMGLRAATTDRVLVVYGDLVFNEEALQAPMNKESVLLYDSQGDMKDREVGCTFGKNHVQQIFYELPNKWAQITYFTGDELELLKRVSWKKDHKMMFGFEAINHIIDRGGRFRYHSPSGMRVTDIDSSRDIAQARQII